MFSLTDILEVQFSSGVSRCLSAVLDRPAITAASSF